MQYHRLKNQCVLSMVLPQSYTNGMGGAAGSRSQVNFRLRIIGICAAVINYKMASG